MLVLSTITLTQKVTTMKRILNKKMLGVLALFTAFASCEKDYTDTTNLVQVDLADKAYVKVFSATTGATRNYAYLPTASSFTPLIGGAAMAYGGTMPAGSTYFSVNEGLNSILIKDTLATSTQAQTFAVGTFERGKYYSIFTYDTTVSIKTKIVVDNIVTPTDTTARFRLANFVRSGSAMPNFDIFSKKRNENIFTNVAVNEVTPFIPYATGTLTSSTDTIYVRATGTTTNLALFAVSTTPSPGPNYLPLTRKRSYTMVLRGRLDANGSTPTVPVAAATFTNY
jgi:hypothetical protein